MSNTPAIRKLLAAAFADDEFTIFCFDYYREVHQKFLVLIFSVVALVITEIIARIAGMNG